MPELCSFFSLHNVVEAPAVVRSLSGLNWCRAEQDVSLVSLSILTVIKLSGIKQSHKVASAEAT